MPSTDFVSSKSPFKVDEGGEEDGAVYLSTSGSDDSSGGVHPRRDLLH